MPKAYENFIVMTEAISGLQDYDTYGNDSMLINDTRSLSLYNNPIDPPINFNIESPPMSTTSSSSNMPPSYVSLDDFIADEPHLVIIKQPADKFRFRYKSEMMGTHGSIVASNNMSCHKKSAPTVQLKNFHDKAIIRCTLVTSDDKKARLPHAHHLFRREGHKEKKDDPHEIIVSQANNFTAEFHGLGIVHTAKKYIKDELVRKLQFEILEERKREDINATLSVRDQVQIKADADIIQRSINLNSVSLCFQAFFKNSNNIMNPLTEPVYSTPINNLKSALTGELKICRIDKFTSSCEGGEEVFLLVERVGKKNIKIKFFELNEDDNEIWCDYGRFSELDVHHQFAIVFRTPPYKDINITSSKEVFIQLERPSDNDCSEPVKFTYKPSDKILGKKRPRISYSNSIELTQSLPTMQNNDPSTNLNDSQEISNELKNILLQGCSSSELRNFINTIDLDRYMQLLNNSEEETLTSDGPTTKKLDDDVMFAKNTVVEAMNIIRIETNDKNEEISIDKKKQLQKLLTDRTTYGDSPLHVALRYGQRDIVKYILILMGIDPELQTLVNIQNGSGKTPLHYAVLQNQPVIIKALLTLGADPTICDDHGFSSLHTAARIPNAGACVDVILSTKLINIETYNDLGWTPLQLAAEAGSYDAVRFLVRVGANVNNTDKSYGRTVLHIAVEGGHKKIVEFLLRNTDIDINKKNFSGNTALHTAVAYSGTRAKELCKLLMQYGADPHIPNNSGSNLDDIEQEINEAINIKVEPESEDENMEKLVGQTSFDLATNKPEILQVLMDHDNNTQDENESSLFIKEEELDEDIKSNWLSNENKEKLATILDKTNGWKKLIQHLKFEFLLQSLCHTSLSPSLLLLNYIDIQNNISLTQMQNYLSEIKEDEAALFIVDLTRHQQRE